MGVLVVEVLLQWERPNSCELYLTFFSRTNHHFLPTTPSHRALQPILRMFHHTVVVDQRSKRMRHFSNNRQPYHQEVVSVLQRVNSHILECSSPLQRE